MPNIAAKVREHKENHPELYCASPRCLWRIVTSRGPSPCQNHPLPPTPPSTPAPTMLSANDLRCGDLIRTEDGSEDRVISQMGGYMAFASGRVIRMDSQSFVLVSRLPHENDTLWTTSGRYYASASDAATWQKIEAERAKRMGDRFLRVIARMAENADLAAD